MHLREYCLAESGRQVSLAEKIGLSSNYLSQIVNGRRPLPIKYCARIEQATNGQVTRRDLRPDDWHEIWPELAETCHD